MAKLSRREFLIGAGGVAAGSLLAACGQPTAAPSPTQAPAQATSAPEPTDVPPTAAPEAAEATAVPTVAEEPVATGYTEAPMLAELVASGELPPIEERLPVEPIMVEPLGEIGQYGGSLRGLVPDPTGESPESDWLRGTALAMRSADLADIIPWVVKGWDLSDDQKELVVHMREGLRWSDGELLTTEDVQFWYEDTFLNTDLTPQVPIKWAPGGEPMKVVIDDDYTFRLQFAVSNPIIIDHLPTLNPWSPKHYMSQFHIKYNEDANEIAKSEGFEFWYESFQFHAQGAQFQQDADRPALDRWIYERQDNMGNRYYVRNPYYWVVDVEGKQLPYADYVERMSTENLEVMNAKVLSGDGTHHSWFLSLENYPLYKQNEAEGNYTVGLYPDLRAAEYGFCFNYTHKDPVLREIFNDIRWRKAMSHAIDRDEINELSFAGLGMPRQPIMDPTASFYEEGIDQYFIEFDVDLANELLDDMGLEWDANQQWRLRPDGGPLSLSFEFWSSKANVTQVSELIKGYWAKVGVDVTLKPEDQQFYQQRMQANEHTIGVWAIGGSSETYSRQNEPIRYRPPWHWPANSPLGGTEWHQWLTTNGEQGIEPPEEIKELWDIVAEWLLEPFGTDRYLELGREMLRINAENLWLIGTVGLVPRAAIVKNTVRNAPQPGQALSVETGMWNYYQPEQWWIEE
ncbi:MAG: ABC transporter substrate-binding protein [Anaerolineae bacterium]|jgi:peptide/nickel transport system substrate-binding protein